MSKINRLHSSQDWQTYLAESKKKINRKLVLQTKTKLVANVSLFFAVLGILIMILETELITNAVYKKVDFPSFNELKSRFLIYTLGISGFNRGQIVHYIDNHNSVASDHSLLQTLHSGKSL